MCSNKLFTWCELTIAHYLYQVIHTGGSLGSVVAPLWLGGAAGLAPNTIAISLI